VYYLKILFFLLGFNRKNKKKKIIIKFLNFFFRIYQKSIELVEIKINFLQIINIIINKSN
jgi:hypothetical protein